MTCDCCATCDSCGRPNETKRGGAGRGNWGKEVDDQEIANAQGGAATAAAASDGLEEARYAAGAPSVAIPHYSMQTVLWLWLLGIGTVYDSV